MQYLCSCALLVGHARRRSEAAALADEPGLPLPPLRCPFGDSISPLADDVDRHVVAWASEWSGVGLTRLRDIKVGRLAARTTPSASPQALEFLADWQMWLFLFDDEFSDEAVDGADLNRLGGMITSFVRVLDEHTDPGGPAAPFTAALTGLVRRLSALATGQQMFRFVSAVRGYFLAQYWEACNRAADRPASLAEYTPMRRHSGAVPTCIALVDMADGFELTADDYYRTDVRAITDVAVNVTCWANDILSYPKESRRSTKLHSLPAVLAQQRRISMAEALTAAAVMHDAEVDRYVAAEEPLRQTAGPGLGRYLDGLRSWMGGNYHWSLETGRYRLTG